jgi:hypothetical protein
MATSANSINATEMRLALVAAAWGIVFIGYGHAGLPLAIAAPAVWVNPFGARSALP